MDGHEIERVLFKWMIHFENVCEDFFESKLVSSSQIQQAIRIAHKVDLHISLDLDCC